MPNDRTTDASWEELFERAESVDLAAIEAALADRRDHE